MTRRRVTMIVGGCLVASILTFALWPGEREPSYKGKTLFQWLEQARGYPRLFDGGSDSAEAVLHIGTNGLPWMLGWLRRADRPDLADRLAKIYVKLPSSMQSQTVQIYLVRRGADAHAQAAMYGLVTLGDRADPALPELAKLAADTNAPARSQYARFAIAMIMSQDRGPRVGRQGFEEVKH